MVAHSDREAWFEGLIEALFTRGQRQFTQIIKARGPVWLTRGFIHPISSTPPTNTHTQAFDPIEGEVKLYIIQVQQLEWPDDDEQEAEAKVQEQVLEQAHEQRTGAEGGGLAAGRARGRRRRRHGVMHRVEPVPPSRCVCACLPVAGCPCGVVPASGCWSKYITMT